MQDNTLWKNIKNLNAGSYLFYKNERIFHCSSYFSYLPYEEKYLTYKKCLWNLAIK